MLSRVQSIEQVETKDVFVNDLQIADNENFSAENVLVHNCHLCAAPAFSKFISRTNSRYLLGLSATPERKDGLERVVEFILGPIRAKGKALGMKPVVEVHDTKFAPKTDWRGMTATTKAITWISELDEHNRMIVKQVFADLREDKRHNIIIPVERRKHAFVLAKMINRQAEINNDKRGEKWDETILAQAYVGGENKKKIIATLSKQKGARVLIAMRKMCKLGLDIPALTHMYLQTPINNAPDFWQLTQRICTFYPKKPQPILRFFVPNIGIYRGCFTSTWWNGVVKRKYKVSDLTIDRAKLIMDSHKSSYRYNKVGGNRGAFAGGGGRPSRGYSAKPTLRSAWS